MNGQKPDLAGFMEELDYSIDFKVRNLHPGKWPAAGRFGAGFSFEKFDRLSNHPDFRRIDLLATGRSLSPRDPVVRVFRETAQVDVIMVADLSLSLWFGSSEPKLFQIAKLATLFGYTAFRFGDRFGFLGFDNRIREEFIHPPLLSKTIGLEIGEDILNFIPSAASDGLRLDLESHLPAQKSLIIFVSDFYIEAQALRDLLNRLARHRVLPIMLRQKRERRWPEGLFGVLRLRDAERNEEKTVFFTRATIKRFQRQAEANEEEIHRLFACLSTAPIVLEEIDPDHIMEELDRRDG